GAIAAGVGQGGRRRRARAANEPRRWNRDLGTARVTEARPAFYALAPGGWRDYVTLLHPPYTLWHLSYVAIGAAIAPHFDAGVMGLTLLAFFLALGVGAHALDELNGRPLRTRISTLTLVALAVLSVVAASAFGVVVAVQRDLWLLAFVAAVSGRIEWQDGHAEPLDADTLTRVPELALRALTAAVVLLALALVLMRVT